MGSGVSHIVMSCFRKVSGDFAVPARMSCCCEWLSDCDRVVTGPVGTTAVDEEDGLLSG